MLLKLGSKCKCDGRIQALKFIHGFQRLVLYSTSTEEADPFFPNYLVNSLGFSKQQSLSMSSKFSRRQRKAGARNLEFNFAAQSDSVINFLQKQGFDRPHIRKVVSYHPKILLDQVDKTLKPKFELLQSLGLSGSDLVQVIMKKPFLLVRNFEPAITTYRQVLGSDDDVVSVISSCHWSVITCFYPNVVTANFALLENSYGISIEVIRKHMIRTPRMLSMRTDLFRDLLSRNEKELGIPRHSTMFLYGVRLQISMSEETLKSKFRTFEDFGWTRSDIMALLRHNPAVFSSSVARFRKCLNVLMNELDFQPSYLAKHSLLFTCSTEKRIIPRHKVLLVLKEKGFIRKDFPLAHAIIETENVFLDKFVLPFQEARQVYSELTGNSVKLIA